MLRARYSLYTVSHLSRRYWPRRLRPCLRSWGHSRACGLRVYRLSCSWELEVFPDDGRQRRCERRHPLLKLRPIDLPALLGRLPYFRVPVRRACLYHPFHIVQVPSRQNLPVHHDSPVHAIFLCSTESTQETLYTASPMGRRLLIHAFAKIRQNGREPCIPDYCDKARCRPRDIELVRP